ncbi:MAG: hypothetical protein IT210_01140 [Armatimonadetes bacterium]|nr:hypothetical protein [Armatimonadota bacterium]
MNVHIRNFVPEDVQAVFDLQLDYARSFPEARVMPGEIYTGPGFENGQNVFCAFDMKGRLRACAPLFPKPVPDDACEAPHTFWIEAMAFPSLDHPAALKDCLLDKIRERAETTRRTLPEGKTRLCFEYGIFEQSGIGYALSRGFSVMPASTI